MFDDIEREYKKGLQEKRFLAYYGPRALIVGLVAVLLMIVTNFDWLIYVGALVIFIGVAAVFFVGEYRHAHKNIKEVRESRGLSAKISVYNKADDAERINKLIADLSRHHIYTKDDLALTLDYFQSRLPSNSKPNLLEWIFTTVVTLSSIVFISYDGSISEISIHRITMILFPVMVAALIILTPLVIAKIISVNIAKNRNKVETSLVQDLAYIYVNFDKYQSKIVKK